MKKCQYITAKQKDKMLEYNKTISYDAITQQPNNKIKCQETTTKQ